MTSFEPQQVSRQVAWPRVTKNRLDKPLYLRYTDKCGPGKIFIISSSLDRENIQKKMFQLKSGKSCSSILIGCTHHSKVHEERSKKLKWIWIFNYLLDPAFHCTVVDGANIAPGREVAKDTSRYGSASSRKVKFTPAHVFEGHTKNFSFLGRLDKEIMQFSWNLWNLRMRESVRASPSWGCVA